MTTPLSDRERILTHVIAGLSSTAIMCRRGDPYDEASWTDSMIGTHVHFVRYRKPVKGDLVIGMAASMGPHEYSIGWYLHPLGPNEGGAAIRAIGSKKWCRYGNEDFTVIGGLRAHDMLEGTRYQTMLKVKRAFAKGDEYIYRFGGIDWDGDDPMATKGMMHVWVREAFGGLNNPSIPFKVTIPYDRRTSVKTILAALRAGGYGTKSFRPAGWVAPAPKTAVTVTSVGQTGGVTAAVVNS